MPANRPNLRPPAAGLLITLLLVGLVQTGSAATYELSDGDTIDRYYHIDKNPGYSQGSGGVYFDIPDMANFQGLTKIVQIVPHNGMPLYGYTNDPNYTGGSTPFVLYYPDTSTRFASGILSWSANYKETESIQEWILVWEFQEWNIPGILSGSQRFSINLPESSTWRVSGDTIMRRPSLSEPARYSDFSASNPDLVPYVFRLSTSNHFASGYQHLYFDTTWKHTVDISPIKDGHNVKITKYNSGSLVIISNTFGDTFYYKSEADDVDVDVYASEVSIAIRSPSKWYNMTYPEESSEPIPQGTVTIYIQNSQTGALLADAHLSILAAAGGTETEVVNATLSGGTGTYTLQPTGGGLPNPDFYRLIATLDGYNSQMPYIDFELTGATTLYVYMEPTAGGPDDENKTYIEFYVRDLSANPIAGAAVTCGGYTLITNSAGYTQFELPNNAAYPYRVTKSGYVTIEGRATVTDAPRHTVNVVLGAGEIPTHTPTLGPGETPGATPTPDRRTNEEKGQAVIDMIADNAEGIGALALICLLMGLLKLMVKW